MTLENKLNITDPAQLARSEEELSKAGAVWLYDSGLLDSLTHRSQLRVRRLFRFLNK